MPTRGHSVRARGESIGAFNHSSDKTVGARNECVSVVFTEHEENGLSNASGLLAILERIKPEVIFLERPPAAFDSYLNGTHAKLESTAVNRYRELHPADLIPWTSRHQEQLSSRNSEI